MLKKEQRVQVSEYLANESVMRVAHKAASTFSKSLSPQEIENCIVTAIWRASNKFEESKGTKFTSYLHRGVVFECLTQRKSNKSLGRQAFSLGSSEDPVDYFNSVDMIDAIKSKCEDPELVIDRFYLNLTYKELAAKHGVVEETIRQRLKKNLNKLKSTLN